MDKILNDFEKIDTYEILKQNDEVEITLKNLPLIKNETSFIWAPSKIEIRKVIDGMFAIFEKNIASRKL